METIIHFTGDLKTLKSILKSTSLKLSYSKENFYSNGNPVSKAVHPMVCFSEYRLDEIHTKNITYGNYGLGFTKEWARRKKIGAVLYVSQRSLAAKGMNTLLRARQNSQQFGLPKNLRLPIMELKCFIKNEQGYNSHFNKQDFDFKSENEWRFVPEKWEIEDNYISQSQSVFEKNREEYNRKLEKFPLKFELKDLQVVFVSNQNEIDLLVEEFDVPADKIRIASWKNSKLKRADN